jgi:aminoglycoside phosphotransferase (APT) family kinase protein
MAISHVGDPLGIHRANVDAWLTEHIPGLVAPVSYRLIAGGRSNLTYELTDHAGGRWALRRPPVGKVLPSAHDMGREHQIIAALSATDVPVPAAVGYCDDAAVSGGPFHVMSFVDGAVIKSEDDAVREFTEPVRAVVATSLVETLAAMHLVDPVAVGLADLGRPDGYVERQLTRWYAQFERSKCREVPDILETRTLLDAHVPAQQRTSIVHGNFRLDNCVFAVDGRVEAVLDWELCTLGDPLADLGLLMVYWIEAGETAPFMPNGTPTVAPGFLTRKEVAARYAQASGLDISALDFYTALGYWKLACILEGMYARYSSGAMAPDEHFPVETCGEQVLALAASALRLARKLTLR